MIAMPRGKKKTALQTIEEQILKIDADIAKYQEKIKGLQMKKNSLLDTKKKEELESLYLKIQESGKSIGEVINFLDEK
jgi:endonuclease/exonuclease/phosphatase family metal-dependent hydrolase